MSHRLLRRWTSPTVILIALLMSALTPLTSQSQTANVELRVEGFAVTQRSQPDSVFVRVAPGTPFNLIWSSETSVVADGVSLGFRLYSRDGSITNVTWNSTITAVGQWADPVSFNFGGTSIQMGPDQFSGSLPSTFQAGGVALVMGEGSGFGPIGLEDILTATLTVDQEGVICVDSAFFPPAAEWLYSPIGAPAWGASIGGYPDGGYCIEVYECSTCDVAGDANGDGFTNIADAAFLLSWTFEGGPWPPCLRQADANGDGFNRVNDVMYLVNRIFGGGPAPICGP